MLSTFLLDYLKFAMIILKKPMSSFMKFVNAQSQNSDFEYYYLSFMWPNHRREIIPLLHSNWIDIDFFKYLFFIIFSAFSENDRFINSSDNCCNWTRVVLSIVFFTLFYSDERGAKWKLFFILYLLCLFKVIFCLQFLCTLILRNKLKS